MEKNKEILKFCMEKGFLVDNDLLELFNETSDIESVKLIIERVKSYSKQNVLTKSFFEKNKDKLSDFFSNLPPSSQENLEKLKIKLGLSIEISKEKESEEADNFEIKENIKNNTSDSFEKNVNILSSPQIINPKIEVKNFTEHFKNRFIEMRNLLQDHSSLNNLVSIDKISGNRQGISIIGMVFSKKTTKNQNILLEVEDLTGKIKVLINKTKKELYEAAENICLDSVLGFRCSGNRKILFVNELIFPEARLPKRKNSPIDESVLFLGDLHLGSKLFLKKSFLKFIKYLNGDLKNSDLKEIKKIKYLFFTGDIVAGLGVYPNQEFELAIPDLEEQFIMLAKLLKKIPKHIKIIISPGNHDGVRLMEPQPIFDEKYAWPLYELENVLITENPCLVNIGSNENFNGFDVLTYHGFSFPYYANNISKLIQKKAMNCPEEIMKYLLQNRHLAPSHGSTQYYPFKKDSLMIRNVPDIFVSGHTHKCGVSYSNNVLIISTSCWESLTSYQKKFGNIPDHCKVPMFNLKTRAIKILDFEEDEFDS